MTIKQFGDATHYIQCTVLKMLGVYMLTKKTGTITARLYQVDNFYVEVQTAESPTIAPLMLSFTIEEENLDVYLKQIDISSLEQLLE